MVPRQPTITTASSASTPIRFSSTNTRRASLSVGTEVYAYRSAAAGKSSGAANCADAASGIDAVQIGRCMSSSSGADGCCAPARAASRISITCVVVNCFGSKCTRTDDVIELVENRSIPSTPVSSRSIAWQRALLRKRTRFLRRSRPGSSDLTSQPVTSES